MTQMPESGSAGRLAGETQSTLSLVDFIQISHRYRWWYVAGLLVVALGTIVWAKAVAPVFYKAESRFFVGRSYTPESMPGVAETEVFRGYTNEQYHARVQGLLAREYLLSADLLVEVVEDLQDGQDGEPVDLYAVLGITEQDPDLRRRMLVRYLRRDLIDVMQVQNSGIMVLTVEMTRPGLAARFNNACLAKLVERFDALQFDQFEQALAAYEGKFESEQQVRKERAGELAELLRQSYYDRFPPIDAQRKAIEEELQVQSEWLAEMRNRIEKLKLATSAEARRAGQPVRIVDYAQPPLKKSRPKTIISTIMTSAIYTFIFLTGLVAVGYLNWVGRTRRPQAQGDAPGPQS